MGKKNSPRVCGLSLLTVSAPSIRFSLFSSDRFFFFSINLFQASSLPFHLGPPHPLSSWLGGGYIFVQEM